MSIKDLAQKAVPKPIEQAVRDYVYNRNCRLKPSQYREALEKWYRFSKGVDPHLDNPQTLGEKMQWLKLYDATPEKGKLADKYLVREWVADKIGEDCLIPILGAWDRPEDIWWNRLPERFVLKATHGSGWNVVVKDKSKLDIENVVRKFNRWLPRRMAMSGGFEMHYEYCEPRIIAEQYMEDSSGGLRDYKFITFYGDVQFVLAIEGRFTDEVSGTYMPDWSPAPFRYGYRVGHEGDIPKPKNLDKMLRFAQKLGEGFAFARVDFYEVEGKVYFGEITFTDANGLSSFDPSSFDSEYGAKLMLPEKKCFKGLML